MGIEQIFGNAGCKVLKAEIPSGQRMPTHYATSEAFVMVTKGEAEIIFSDGEQPLKEGTTILIPERKPHTLHILKDFEAFIVIGGKAKIEYASQTAKHEMSNI
jgi:quercetin dioxygenase-like cupin family protein